MKKILLVEDTIEALHALKDLLEIEGYEVATATNGDEAVDQLHAGLPDLIITDLRMPKMDGFELLKYVRLSDSSRSVPVIVFSANATFEQEKKSRELGASAFLSKPTSIEKLLEYIVSAIGQPD